jgi:hypothetical protein
VSWDAVLRHDVATAWLALAAMKAEMLVGDAPDAGAIAWPLWIPSPSLFWRPSWP